MKGPISLTLNRNFTIQFAEGFHSAAVECESEPHIISESETDSKREWVKATEYIRAIVIPVSQKHSESRAGEKDETEMCEE